MKRRDAIIEEVHKVREQIGRAHDFDVDRIAATIRRHEHEAGRPSAGATPARTPRRVKTRARRAARRRGAVSA
jgi:hypothetical protein